MSDAGPPILFENFLIRKMLDLAAVKHDDTFYDLGSGYGQNLIIAARHSRISKGVGFEVNHKRASESRRRIERAGYSDRIKILTEDLRKADLSDASVVFYCLSPGIDTTKKFMNELQAGCRLVYYVNCPQPAIIPDKMDYPFYIATGPLREAKSEKEWLRAHVPGITGSEDEYWSELLCLSEDGHPYGKFGTDAQYGGVLKRLLRMRLKQNSKS